MWCLKNAIQKFEYLPLQNGFVYLNVSQIDDFLRTWQKYVIKRKKNTNSMGKKSIGFQSFSIVNCSFAMIWKKKSIDR